MFSSEGWCFKLIFHICFMKLHILRHAKTEPLAISGRDFDRKLLPKGQRQVKALHTQLIDLSLGEVHCSSSARTRQTLTLLAPKLEQEKFVFSDDLYLCSHLQILQYINQIRGGHDLLLIGHNNGLSDFVTYLTGDFVSLKTAAYMCLEIEVSAWEQLSRNTATVLHSFRPEVE